MSAAVTGGLTVSHGRGRAFQTEEGGGQATLRVNRGTDILRGQISPAPLGSLSSREFATLGKHH